MKKQLLKLTLLVAVLFSVSTVQAQALYTVPGTYKISTSGLSPNLYMTINGEGGLVWAAELPDNDASQVWTVTGHRTPASTGFIEITSKAGGLDWTLTTSGVEADHPNYTITVAQRLPKEVAYTPESSPGAEDAVYSNDLSGLDQFQRRKTKVNAEGLYDSSGSTPATGPNGEGNNNALFIKTPWGGNSRYGVTPSAAGDAVQFDGAGIDVIQYHLIEAATASVNTFGVDAFSISNPVGNQLTIKGATSKIQKLSLFSVLGNKVLSKSVSNSNGDINLDVNSLATGLYILKLEGANGEKFSKKILKQ